ncbi:MAG: D-alanine--D-alanine ligase family protein [Erysipelotrichaceae bacterium]|nr:D-alanine--D-alanine ligase family protein [Erysipelotrichaceae bacterium]
MKVNVGVLFGGESVEHEVSIISAVQAMEALDKTRYEVIPIYISKSHVLYTSPLLRDIKQYKDLNKLIRQLSPVSLVRQENQVIVLPLKKYMFSSRPVVLDVVIPVVHGTHAEDGTVQGYLEMLGVPYAGCDVIAAGVGQDKVIMKHVLENSKLPVVPWFWFYGGHVNQSRQAIVSKALEIGYPLIIKPACLGSSIGIRTAHDEAELFEGIEFASMYDRKILVERKLENIREVNCSVLGVGLDMKASSIEEVLKTDDILSYENKYQGSSKGVNSKGMASTSRQIPADVGQELTERIKHLAIKTFEVLGANGVSRIDFLIDANTMTPYVNEINTIPGSLSFYLWQHDGLDFTALMDILVEQAIDRQRSREKMVFSYQTNLLANFDKKGSKGSK